jgi:hypothetical protein
MGPKFKRKRLWVDPAFQCRLLARLCLHLLLFALAVIHITFLFELMGHLAWSEVGQGVGRLYLEFLGRQKPVLVTLVLVTPLLLYDLLRFSHRIAGPLYRCRQVMGEMANGRSVPAFQPRKHDLMRELFRAFNALVAEWNARVGAGPNGGRGDAPRAERMATAGDPCPGSTAVAAPQPFQR